ncbi:hypothetical protein OG871_34695 [Kitasatospora sp. NBC_00374]|uniref:hypothetical protein n=1 Tax=Kitasatospora sp. NBC_00374 TaxID=2975964 RepID=UPI0030E2058D
MTDAALDRLHLAVRRTREHTAGRATTGLSHQAADDTLGTFATDGAHGFDPFPLLGALHRAGARVVVIGQVAGILHGSTELTGDLDLLWDGDLAQSGALAAAFAEVGARLADEDGVELPMGPDAFRLRKLDFSSPAAGGDCCTPALPWGVLPVGDFLNRALTATAPDGTQVHYLRRDDLILMRRAVARPKDLRRAAELDRL